MEVRGCSRAEACESKRSRPTTRTNVRRATASVVMESRRQRGDGDVLSARKRRMNLRQQVSLVQQRLSQAC
jgi:hypothetical protein